MTRWMGAAIAAAGLLLATGAAAQEAAREETNGLERPGTSIEVGAGAGALVGVWQRVSPRVSLGVQVSAYTSRSELESDVIDRDARQSGVSVGPALKVYGGPGGAFLPYGFASAFLEFGESREEINGGGEREEDLDGVGGELGVGIDWFPVRRVSIGGHVGVEAHRQSRPSDDDDVNRFTIFNTVSSGIRVQLYF